MTSSHDGWAHMRDLAQDLGADSTIKSDIRDKVLDVYTRINDGDITALNERDAQTLCEAIMQSVRDTKSLRS